MGRELLAHQIGKRMQARVEFDPADFESGSGNHVGVFVAYKETSGDVDWPVARSLLKHAGTGFTAVAGHGECLHSSFRMMRTIIEGIDVSAFFGQHVLHMRVERFYRRFVEEPTRHARLIGNHQHIIAGLIEQAHAFGRPRYPFKLLGSVHIAVIDVENPVAIEERGRAACP